MGLVLQYVSIFDLKILVQKLTDIPSSPFQEQTASSPSDSDEEWWLQRLSFVALSWTLATSAALLFYTKDGRSSPKGLEKGRLKQFNGALVWRLAEVPEVIISLMYFVCILYCSCALSIGKWFLNSIMSMFVHCVHVIEACST